MTDTSTPSTEHSPSEPAGEAPSNAAWPGPPPVRPRAENRFLAWMRGRGIPRRHGWVGGVCAGLAARMGVDPLIVRGIFVVAALLGLPALLMYAIAWALLPDEDGRIHFEELVRGRFEPAIIAILIAALVGLIPTVPILLVWVSGGTGYYSDGSWLPPGPDFFLGPLLVIVLVALVVWLIVWAVRSASRRRAFAAQMDASAPGSDSGSGEAMPVTDASAGPAPAPAADELVQRDSTAGEHDGIAPPTDLTEWREQQQAWREQHDEWRRTQADADRAARAQARAERAGVNAAFAAEAAARRAQRRATNPRASGAFVLAVIGSCLVLGTGFGLVTMNGELGAYSLAIGLLVAAATAATGMILAGLLRRRSGFLAFFAATLLVLGLAAPAATDDRVLLVSDTYIGHTSSDTFLQPWSTFQLELWPGAILPAGDTINLIKGTGWTYVIVHPGVELDLRAKLGSVTLITQRGAWDGKDEMTEARETVHADSGTLQTLNRQFSARTLEEDASGGLRTVTLNLEQRTGEITVIIVEPTPSEAPASTPTETPTEEDGA